MPWEHVDAGWGRCAPEFAYLFENLHWREYLHLLDQTGVGPSTPYLDIACGSGLAVQLACERDNTGAMVRIGMPGAAEDLMRAAGLAPGERTSLRFSWEFPDVELTARALATTGPGYLAIQHLGADAFMASAREAAAQLYMPGIGVRAEVEVQCLVGTAPD
jgi:hypothetical protein